MKEMRKSASSQEGCRAGGICQEILLDSVQGGWVVPIVSLRIFGDPGLLTGCFVAKISALSLRQSRCDTVSVPLVWDSTAGEVLIQQHKSCSQFTLKKKTPLVCVHTSNIEALMLSSQLSLLLAHAVRFHPMSREDRQLYK